MNKKLKKHVIENFEEEENMEKESFEVESDEIFKENEEKQIAYSIVLKADRPDLEKDTFVSEEIEKAAHSFMQESQDINLGHEFDTDKVQIVESYIAPTDFELNGTEIKKGDWIMGTRFLDQDLWSLCKENKLSGFSIEGTCRKVPASEV